MLEIPPNAKPGRLRTLARATWRLLPEALRYRCWVGYQRWTTRRYAASSRRAPKLAVAPPGSPIVVAGLFRAANGLGEAARSTYRSLCAAGLNPIAVDVTEVITRVDIDPDIPLSTMPLNGTGTLILHVNPPEAVLAFKHLGLADQRRWRTIGYWAWELPTFPSGWEIGFDLVSEVWTLSEFSARALMIHPRARNVRWAPIAVRVPARVHDDRTRFGIRPAVFTAITMADAQSSFGRKNPIGAIQAFRVAFGDRSDCELIVKTRNLPQVPSARRAIERAVAGASNIRVLDVSMSDSERWNLLASVDVFVSLHRAEGFALGPAEAMALGKPVIATGWSGNMSYMTADTATLVDYRLTRVEDEFGIYAEQNATAVWAEPDVDLAAIALKRIERDRCHAREIGQAAMKRIEEVLAPAVVGRRLASFLAACDSGAAPNPR